MNVNLFIGKRFERKKKEKIIRQLDLKLILMRSLDVVNKIFE